MEAVKPLTRAEHAIYETLLDAAGGSPGRWLAVPDLAHATQVGERTVRSVLRPLSTQKWLMAQIQPRTDRPPITVYKLRPLATDPLRRLIRERLAG